MPRIEGDRPVSSWARIEDGPKMVAVLPFINETEEEGIHILVRDSFYGQLSALNYYDLELKRLDDTLQAFQKSSGRAWGDLLPAEMGELLHADLIIFGKVKSLKRYFLGIYSQIALEVEVEMVASPRSGS